MTTSTRRRANPSAWVVTSLRFDPAGIPSDVAACFPHLRNHLALSLAPETGARAPDALRCQVAVSLHLPSGRLVNAGSLQVPGVIDELYAAAPGPGSA